MGTILIVDDSKINRTMLSHILKDEYEIIEAENGREAVSTMYKEYRKLSAVFLDLQMPVMDGFQVLKMKGVNPVLSQIPVIVVTASDDTETRDKAIAAGANDVFVKPFDAKKIRECLTCCIDQHELNAAASLRGIDHLTNVFRRESFYAKAYAKER